MVKEFFIQYKRPLFLLTLFAILPSILSSAITYLIYKNYTLFQNQTLIHLLLFYLITSFTMALAITPSTFIAVVSGFFFGWKSFPFLVFSYLFASWIGLKVGEKLKIKTLKNYLYSIPRVAKVTSHLEKNHLWFIASARLSPALPFAMLNILFSNFELSLWRYLMGSLIGMLPRTFISFWAGRNFKYIKDLLNNQDLGVEYKILWIVLFLVSLMGMYLLVRKATRGIKSVGNS